ncbi:MAG: hypothetical protein MUO26_08450 [Methanotrichaceae archaeon]|nr:hypothetical protein [Methanotrichaceae archaeon]
MRKIVAFWILMIFSLAKFFIVASASGSNYTSIYFPDGYKVDGKIEFIFSGNTSNEKNLAGCNVTNPPNCPGQTTSCDLRDCSCKCKKGTFTGAGGSRRSLSGLYVSAGATDVKVGFHANGFKPTDKLTLSVWPEKLEPKKSLSMTKSVKEIHSPKGGFLIVNLIPNTTYLFNITNGNIFLHMGKFETLCEVGKDCKKSPKGYRSLGSIISSREINDDYGKCNLGKAPICGSSERVRCNIFNCTCKCESAVGSGFPEGPSPPCTKSAKIDVGSNMAKIHFVFSNCNFGELTARVGLDGSNSALVSKSSEEGGEETYRNFIFKDLMPNTSYWLEILDGTSIVKKSTFRTLSICSEPKCLDLGESLFVKRWEQDKDNDRDGLKDSMEYKLADYFKPYFVFDGNESNTKWGLEPITLFQVRPFGCIGSSCNRTRSHDIVIPCELNLIDCGNIIPFIVIIKYQALWEKDGGYGPDSDCDNDHWGDSNDHPFYLVSCDGQTWSLGQAISSKFGWSREACRNIFYDEEGVLYEDSISPGGQAFKDGIWDGSHLRIFLSAHKHHDYLDTTQDHEDSVYSDWGCNDDVNGASPPVQPNLISPYPDGRPNNVGEPEAHSPDYFINSLDLFGFPGENAWSNKYFLGGHSCIELCMWGDDCEKICSDPILSGIVLHPGDNCASPLIDSRMTHQFTRSYI